MQNKTERFKANKTKISGVFVLNRKLFYDDRGSFSRLLCNKEMKDLNISSSIEQINISKTTNTGTIRGMHYQTDPDEEDKYVICLKGSVFDVALDVRKESQTYLQWDSVLLSADSNKMIYIPKGVAHGFQALEPNCWLLYLHTASYSPESENGLNPLDPELAINWPISEINMSKKDSDRKYIQEIINEL
jgi:dTDP-4-dehydrorhamnose 3,5-epimerase